jgi:hypothetical protein
MKELRRHLEVPSGRRTWPKAAGLDGGTEGGRESWQAGPTWRWQEREKTSWSECANPNRWRLLVNTPKHFGPSRLSGGGGLVQRSWAGSQEKIQIDFDFKFQGIRKFGKTWRNCTRRFRWNLDMEFFPKFFYASQGFLKKYNMPCHKWNLRPIKLRIFFFRLNFPKMQPNADKVLWFKKWVL